MSRPNWRHRLLDRDYQRLVRRLSMVGGCTPEAVAAVCRDPCDGITSLINQSSVQPLARAGGEPCYALLETIRE
jgi:hypothetical protein